MCDRANRYPNFVSKFILSISVAVLLLPSATLSAPEDGLIAYWPLDGNAIDVSGNSHNGSVIGSVPTEDRLGNSGAAMFFDGSGDYITVPSHSDLDLNNVRTVSLWLRKDGRSPSGNGAYAVIGKYQNDTWTEDGWAIVAPTDASDTTALRARVKKPNQTAAADASSTISNFEWHHAAWVYRPDHSEIQLYVDGILTDVEAVPSTPSSGNPRQILMGASPFNTGVLSSSSWFHGAIDDIRIYDRVLSQSEITDLASVDNDSDDDGVLDISDNCVNTPNTDQANNDGDAEGDACDVDDDNDGINDDAPDNCPFVSNADQVDLDGDGQGDACDGDLDGDGTDNGVDNCPDVPNHYQTDTDGDALGDACDPDDDNDGVGDNTDNCPTTQNPDQTDSPDGDGIGNMCDADDDNDGTGDDTDNCPATSNSSQDDTDFDGLGDACDPDDDNDGVADGDDNCPYMDNPDQADNDGDGQGDVCDGDLDGDGWDNDSDNCPTVANSSQNDFDGDSEGDACDSDIDGDDVGNIDDACPFTPIGEIVDPGTGCSLEQLSPCEGPRGTNVPWKNKGKYVSSVTQSAQSFVDLGLITEDEKGSIVSSAAESTCGEK